MNWHITSNPVGSGIFLKDNKVHKNPATSMLVDGRDKIENGWSQGRMRQRESTCMIGSLTITDYDIYLKAEDLLCEAIHGLGYAYSTIVAFNDALGRTKEEVLRVYNTAILLSEETFETVLVKESINA